MMKMKRYVIKLEDKFVKWIQWTAGIVPHVRLDEFDEAMIIDSDYLKFVIESTNETRKISILNHYPNAEIIEVEVKVIGNMFTTRKIDEIAKCISDTRKSLKEVDAFIDTLTEKEMKDVLKESARCWKRKDDLE